jgi:hypothetical protein
MDVVGDGRRLHQAEIADAGATGKEQRGEKDQGPLEEAMTKGFRQHRRTLVLAASHPPATAILRRRRGVRLGILGVRLVVPFNANDRQDDDGGGLFRSVRAAKAYDTSLVGKLDNGAHGGGPAIVPLPVRQRTPLLPVRTHAPASSQVSGMQG